MFTTKVYNNKNIIRLCGEFYLECLPIMVLFNTTLIVHYSLKPAPNGALMTTSSSPKAFLMGVFVGVTWPIYYPYSIYADTLTERWIKEFLASSDDL